MDYTVMDSSQDHFSENESALYAVTICCLPLVFPQSMDHSVKICTLTRMALEWR